MGTVPTPARPGAGTVLLSAETDSWADALVFALKPPACRAYNNAVQNIPASTASTIIYGAEEFDQVQAGDAGMHSTSVNTDRITIPTAGRYDIVAVISATMGLWNAQVYKSGVGIPTAFGAGSFGGQQDTATIIDSVQCAIGDYIQVLLALGATPATIGTSYPSSLYVKWVSN